MNAKLTLKLDKDTIERTKRYAKRNHVSLSALVEMFFRVLLERQKDAPREISALVRELTGIIDLDDDFVAKEEYTSYLEKKYR